MSEDSVLVKGLIYDTEPPTASDNDEWRGTRLTRYNEQYNQPIGDWRYARAREQTYFVATNPVIDSATTIAGHVSPVLASADATLVSPLIHLMMPSGTSVLAELDYIEIDVVAANAAGTTAEWTDQLDSGVTRVTTAATSLTRVNPNMRSSTVPQLAVQAGPVVTGVESSNVRRLGNGVIRMAIEFAGDRITFLYGREPSPGANVVSGAASRHVITRPPVILGATDQYMLALFAAASASGAGIYRIRVAWSER